MINLQIEMFAYADLLFARLKCKLCARDIVIEHPGDHTWCIDCYENGVIHDLNDGTDEFIGRDDES